MPPHTRQSQTSRRRTRRTQQPRSSPQGKAGTRRSEQRTPPPVDYSEDYAFVRHDLKRIVLFSSILMVIMIALYFVL